VARVKGLTFADIQAFVRQEGGDAAWAKLKDSVTADDRAVVESVVAVGWYPLDVQLRVLGQVHKVLVLEPMEAMRKYARFAAERHVSRVYRVLFLVLNPALMLEKSGEYWHRFYDNGEWKVHRDSPTKVRGDLVGFAQPDPNQCEFLNEYLISIFARIGAKDVKCTHPRCRVRGDAVCSYHLEWR
jgi:hypothetical protein